MNQEQYRSFYDQVGVLNGWDFSSVKLAAEGVQWEFYNEVIQRCGRSDLLLDIGTGGGEALLSIADHALLLVGIDQSAEMIQTARANLLQANKANVRFLQMDAEEIGFPDRFFHIVSCRHSEFHAKETARVLAPGGVFLTQQVSEHDKLNLKHAYGRGQSFGVPDGSLRRQCEADLAEAGFTDIRSFEYDADEYYETYEDLVFLLKFTPIIPNFGQIDSDFERLQQFIEANRTDRGIRTNAKRFMIVAKVPEE